MNKILIILLTIILIVLVFVLGGLWGIYYQKQQDADQINRISSIVKNLSAGSVSAVVYGDVEKIEENQITISANGSNVKININNDTEFFPVLKNEKEMLSTNFQGISLKDIKSGDKVNIIVKILPDGQLQGQLLRVMSE
jgi:preprotein translocase subunit YajC